MISAGWKWIERGTDLLWPASLEVIFAASVLLVIAVAMHFALGRAAASLRHRVWALTMGALLLVPLLCPILPKLPLPLNIPIADSRTATLTAERPSGAAISQPPAKTRTDSEVHPTASALPVASARTPTGPLPPAAYPLPAPEANPRPVTTPVAKASIASGRSLLAISHTAFVLVWAIGTLLYLLAMARWLWLERRMAKSARPLDDPSWQALLVEMKLELGIRWTVALGVGQESVVPLAIPLVIGWLRPKILLPLDCTSWTAEKCRAVLAHELSHVARHDVFWQILARLACAVYWFHPLAWIAERRMRVERELACDDAVLRSGSQPDQYAAVLLDVAAAVSRRPRARAAGIAMACRHPIQRRIRAILEPGLNRLPVSPRTGRSLLAAALLLAVLSAGLHPFAPPTVKADPPKSAVAAAKSENPAVRSIQIRVVNQAGKPVVGAKVKLWGIIQKTRARFDSPGVNTDGAGAAVVEFPRETTSSVIVSVSADDYVTASARWGDDVPAKFTFTLEPGTIFGGVVRDEQGHAITGVEVRLVFQGEENLPEGIRNRAEDSLRTDAQGRWTSRRVPKVIGRYVFPRIELEHPDYASPPMFDLSSRPLDQLRAGTAVMVLRKGFVVEGVVTDPRGKPVAEATVALFPEVSGSKILRAAADQKGRYRFPLCEVGEYTVAAAANGFVPTSQRIAVGKGSPSVDLQLGKGELIRVRVIDKRGRPVQAATVANVSDRDHFPEMIVDSDNTRLHDKDDRFLLTDAEGRWSRLWIPGDTVEARISKPGYGAAHKKVWAGGPEGVVTLEPGGWSLSGRVVDRDTKAPITKFYLVEGNDFGTLRWRERTAMENAQGEFRKQWDDAGDTRRAVRIEADTYQPSESLTLFPEDRAATFNAELQKAKEIAGVVRGPDGKPVAGADVALASATRYVLLQNSRLDRRQNSLLARTGADGRFQFAPQGEPYMLVATHDLGFGCIGGDANSNEIILRPWARIEGTVYVDGRPAENEQVRLFFNDRGVEWALYPLGPANPRISLYFDYQTQTDDKGHYAFDRVRSGSATISRHVKVAQVGTRLSLNEADTRAIDIAAGKTLTIDLGKPDAEFKPPADVPSGQSQSDPSGSANAASAKVAGKVVDENGKPLAGADVWLPMRLNWVGVGPALHAKSDDQGRFALEIDAALLAKRKSWDAAWTVWAYASGRRLGTAPAWLPNHASDVVIRLGPATDTSFVVLDDEGRPCAGALVEPYYVKTGRGYEPLPEQLTARVAARTDARGRVKLPATSRETLDKVRITAKDFGIQVQGLEKSKPPAVAASTIRLRSVGKIEGRLIANQAEVARDVRLIFTSRDPEGSSNEGFADVKSDKDGHFDVPALAYGDLHIDVRVNENQLLRPKIPQDDVGPGETVSLEIHMVPTVLARGSVREKDTEKPIPDARVHVDYDDDYHDYQGADVVTDAQGKFTVPVFPGRIRSQVSSPGEYVQLGESRNRRLAVPEGAKEFALPPMELVPAKDIAGRLVDEHDLPVPTKLVCVFYGGQIYGTGMSDSTGRFELSKVPATIDPAKADYKWTPDLRSFHKCEVLKTTPLILRALPGEIRKKSP